MNIFLVEDERWALAELVELFKVYDKEHEVYAFETGEDALEAAKRIRPHLVLSDINMPGMDGLEFLAGMMQLHPAVKGVILSVHDQFDYAQKSLRMGIVDFLVKPVKKEALYQTIDKTIALINSELLHKQDITNWTIARMLTVSSDEGSVTEASFVSKSYFMALLFGNWAVPRGWKETRISNKEIKERLLTGPNREHDSYCVDIDRQRKIVMIPCPKPSLGADLKVRLFALYEEWSNNGVIVHVSCDINKEQEHPNKTVCLLTKQIEEHRKLGVPSWIPPEAKARDVDLSGIWDRVRMVETLFKRGEMAKGKEMVGKIVSELQQKDVSMRQLQMVVNDILYSIKFNMQQTERMEANPGKLQENLTSLHEIVSYDELTHWLGDKLWSIFTDHLRTDIYPKKLIPALLSWIHTNYRKPLSLQSFAAEHHISLGYLSRLFKAQTGRTFSEYVIRYRIEKAKELLVKGVDRLSDISTLVGYEDTKHFSALFKKIVGESPMAFMRNHR